MIAAPAGSTGANTHASLRVHPAAKKLAFVPIVDTGGATPAISPPGDDLLSSVYG